MNSIYGILSFIIGDNIINDVLSLNSLFNSKLTSFIPYDIVLSILELLNIMETSFKMNNKPDILNIDSSKVKILDYNTENDTSGPDVIINK